MPILLLAHVPPAGVELNVLVVPSQIERLPEMADGSAFTVMFTTLVHPVPPAVYVIFALPVDTPVITPVAEPIVTIVVADELHEPPEVLLDSVPACPAHIENTPDIAPGNGFTVTTVLLMHPVANV
jgi:hypothetical protein